MTSEHSGGGIEGGLRAGRDVIQWLLPWLVAALLIALLCVAQSHIGSRPDLEDRRKPDAVGADRQFAGHT